MKIAIVGAGISGLSFYLFLQKYGLTEKHDITIYEARQATESSDAQGQDAEVYNASVIGASIGLSTNGLKVLQRLDERLFEEVKATGHVLTTCKISTARGWILADVPAGRNGEEILMIGREAFWQCLRKRVPERVIVRKKMAGVEIRDVSNSLVFSGGSREEADLVVGADGIWSAVRRSMFDSSEGKGEYEYSPHYEGLVGVGSFVPSSTLADVPNGQMNVVFGPNGFFGYAYTTSTVPPSTAHGDKAVWWSTYTLQTLPPSWRDIDTAAAKKQLQTRHSSWKNATIQNIIHDVEITSLYPTYTTPLLPTYSHKACVLIGDAAHALQPSSAQGGSMALEDCEVLALLLKHHLSRSPGGEPEKGKGCRMAVKQYGELRMPRVGMVHKKAQEVGALKGDMSFWEEMVMYVFIWMINCFNLSDKYHRALYDYDGPKEVEEKLTMLSGTSP